MPEPEAAHPPPPRSTFTLALVLLNVAVAVAMTASGVSIWLATPEAIREFGGADPSLIWRGDFWRLLTATFVHGGAWHLGLNMWVLLQIGTQLERTVGSARFLLIYVVSGIFGFAVSMLSHARISAGSSGAIFGATGALLAIAVLTRHGRLGRFLLAALMPFVVGTLALGYLVPIVDNTAHIGGLVCGFLLGFGLCAGERGFVGADEPASSALRGPVPLRERVLGAISLVSAFALFVVVVPYALKPVWSPRFHVIMGLQALAAHDVAGARVHEARARALGPNDAATLVLIGRLLIEEGGDDVAKGEGEIALALARADDDPRSALTLTLLDLGFVDGSSVGVSDPRTGTALCDAALAAQGDKPAPLLRNECAWWLLEAPNTSLHDAQRALALAERAVAESQWRQPELIHTLAVALGRTGKPREAQIVLERMAAQGLSGAGDFYDRERARFAALADAAEAPVSTPSAPDTSDP